MSNFNELLTKIEDARLWNFFHKDWLLQMRLSLRDQLPGEYRVFVESEAVLISPDSPETPSAVILPDVSVTLTGRTSGPLPPTQQSTTAVIETEEACETETHYSLIIRRAPENFVVAALELLSPSNKGTGNRWDREKHLRKRAEYLDAGVSLLEIDALLHGERDVPAMLMQLTNFERIAWTAYHSEGRRKYRGWGWNLDQPLPKIDWQIDTGQTPQMDLQATLQAAAEFNQWADFVSRQPASSG